MLRDPVKAWSLWLWFRDALSAHHSSHCHIQHFAEGWGDPKPSLWGWFPAAPAVCCSLGDISSLSVPFSWNLSSPKVPHKLLPMDVQNYSHIHSGNCGPGSISRFEKIADNKSSVFPLPTRWYLHFPFPLIHFILWFISHAEAKLFKI